MDQLTQYNTAGVVTLITGVVFFAVFFFFGLALIYMFLQWLRHHGREKYSLEFKVLKVMLPKDNEIKIDAAEQMFASLYSLKHRWPASWFKAEDHFTFEIVALKESIVFYVSAPARLRDLIEKQIYGAYPSAEIQEADEPNIFSQGGKVAFTALRLEEATYLPIKTYKDLPTDGL